MKFWMGLAMIAIGIALVPSGIGIIFTIPLFLLGLVLIVFSILHGGLSVITAPFRRRNGKS
jgi:hypothetical protein